MKQLILITTLVGALSCFAQPGNGPRDGKGPGGEGFQKMKSACQSDEEKFCAGKKGPERMECMVSNLEQLSSECKTFISEMKDRRPPQRPEQE